MTIASFQMMNRCYSDSDMMVQGFPSVAILCQAGQLKHRAIDSSKTYCDDWGWFSSPNGCYACGPRRKKPFHAIVVWGLCYDN